MQNKVHFSDSQGVLLFVALCTIGIYFIFKYEVKISYYLIKISNYVQTLF